MAHLKTNEADSVKKLVWMIAWALFILGGAGFSVLFTLIINAGAEQESKMETMVSQPQFSQLFAQVQVENRREHDLIFEAVAVNTAKTETNSTQISSVDSKVSKILGIVEILVDAMKDDDDE